MRFIRRLILFQSVAPRQVRAEIICLRVDLLALGSFMDANGRPLRNSTCPSSVTNFKEYLMPMYLVS